MPNYLTHHPSQKARPYQASRSSQRGTPLQRISQQGTLYLHLQVIIFLVDLMLRVTPESDFGSLEDYHISIDGLRINLAKSSGAFEVDSGIKEGKGSICLVEIGEEEGLVGDCNLIYYLDWGLLILIFPRGVAVLPCLTPIIAMTAVVEVSVFGAGEEKEGEDENCYLHSIVQQYYSIPTFNQFSKSLSDEEAAKQTMGWIDVWMVLNLSKTYIDYLKYKVMGNLLDCGVVNPKAQAILKIIKIAIQNNHQPSLPALDHSILEDMVRKGAPTTTYNGGIEAKVIIAGENPQIESIGRSMKLLLLTDLSASSTIGEIPTSKGYIMFPNAYYFGEIVQEKAQGFGTLHIPNSLYQVQGLWSADSLQHGKIIKLKPQILEIQKMKMCDISLLNGEDQAQIVTETFEYTGSINLSGATEFNQMMTGKGKVTFQNGNTYDGQLVNGLFQTPHDMKAKYTYAQGIVKSYYGFFKKGLRDGRGILRVEDLGEEYLLNVRYEDGKVVENGIAQVGNIEYELQFQGQCVSVVERLQ